MVDGRDWCILSDQVRGARVLERQKTMSEVLMTIGFVVAWIVLNRWVLPKLGVAT